MRGITLKPGLCIDCGKDLPVPRSNIKKRCDDCSHQKDLARMAKWYTEHAVSAKRQCKFQGGIGLVERYRPEIPCLGEFEPDSPNPRNCKNCRRAAKKWHSAQSATAKYKANPKKSAAIARKYRWNRAKAAGRSILRIGKKARCKYRDNDGNRGRGCLGTFERKSSFQKFCSVCQKHADADRAQTYREVHRNELLPVYREKGKRLRQLARVGNKISALGSMTKASQWAGIALLVDHSLTNSEVRKLANVSPRQLVRIREFIDVPAPKGRPSKKL